MASLSYFLSFGECIIHYYYYVEIYAEIAFSTFCEGTGPTDAELPLPFEGKMTCSDLKVSSTNSING